MRIADLNGDGKAELLGSLTNRHSCNIQYLQQSDPIFYLPIHNRFSGIAH